MTTVAYTSGIDVPLATPLAPRSMKSLGRRAGLLYFLASLPAPFALLFVPGRIIVPRDIAATAERVRENAMLLRASVVVEIWGCLFLFFAAIALYRMLREADRYLAVVTAGLILVSLPIQLLNLVSHMAPLILTSGTTFLSAFTREQVDGLAYLFLRLHASGIHIAQIFWGIWLIPWGVAAYRTGFMPRWIGAALVVAGVGYMLNSAVAILAPQLTPVLSTYLLALGVGEIANVTWLLVRGAREPDPSRVRLANL